MNLIPNIPPKAFSFSAVIVGYLLIDDMTANEQNAVGNWIMLIAQTLCTNGSYTFNKEWKSHIEDDNGITKDTLRKTSDIINREINKL